MQKRLTNNITAMIGKGVRRDVGGNNHPGENWLLLLGCSGVDHGGRDKSAITAQRDTTGLVEREEEGERNG
jgi:hypothetical protein